MRAVLLLGSAAVGVDAQDFFLGSSRLHKEPSYPKPDYPTPGAAQPAAPQNGAQYARNNTPALPDAACPPPTGWPMPPDGLGIGPVLVNHSMLGLPQKSQSCGNCGPKCKKIQDAFAHAFDMYSKGDHGATLNQYATGNAYFTTTGYGATSHACHGHTFMGASEVSGEINKCYSFEARIGNFFWPTALDIIVSNCGDKAVLQMGCVNCTNDAGFNYPQRYSWVVQIQEAPWLDAGFQFYRNHGLLDSELTLGMTIEEFSYDPYICSYLESPLHPFPPLPTPHSYDVPTNVPVLEKVSCEECPKCDSRYSAIENAFTEAIAGRPNKIFDMMADDVVFDIIGDGPTQAACFGHVYEGKEQVLTGERSPIKRLQAMVTSYELLSTDLMIDSCGTKFNAFYIFYLHGKSSFQYTMNVDVAFYLDDKEDNEHGFTVSYVRIVPDTEVLMNLAEREQAHDTFKCDKLGDWTYAVTHTLLQP